VVRGTYLTPSGAAPVDAADARAGGERDGQSRALPPAAIFLQILLLQIFRGNFARIDQSRHAGLRQAFSVGLNAPAKFGAFG